MFRRIAVWSIVPVIAVTATAYTFSDALKPTWLTRESGQHQADTAVRVSPQHVRSGVLWPQLREYLKALGGRIEGPGKERLLLTGTLDRAGEADVAFKAIAEFPDRLKLVTETGSKTSTIKYDGQVPNDRAGALSSAERKLIETLVHDSAEHFFKAQTEGAPTRHLGDRFRADDGASENYTGPYHDIFSLSEAEPAATSLTKLYFFNSETRLLEKVTYQIALDGAAVEVETQFSDWRKVQDQQVAHRIVRLENGQPVMSLKITSASVAARGNDGQF